MFDFDTSLVVGLIVGLAIGIGLTLHYIARRLNTLMDAMTHESHNVVNIIVEQHDNIYLLYDEDSGKFILQTHTLAELCELIKNKFPEHTCYISSEDKQLADELAQVVNANRT